MSGSRKRNQGTGSNPEFAPARTSRPAVAIGHEAAWTGDGVVKPCEQRIFTICSGNGAAASEMIGLGADGSCTVISCVLQNASTATAAADSEEALARLSGVSFCCSVWRARLGSGDASIGRVMVSTELTRCIPGKARLQSTRCRCVHAEFSTTIFWFSLPLGRGQCPYIGQTAPLRPLLSPLRQLDVF